MNTVVAVKHRLLRRKFIVAAVILSLGVALAAWRLHVRFSGVSQAPNSFALPPYSASHFQNVSADARHIGSAACAKCHPNNHQSYLRTPHSRALSEVNPASEPPDGAFHHKLTGRDYRVYRENGRLHQEEVLRDDKGQVVARVDRAARYLIGSGHFSRSYIVEDEGFLYESPITFYASKQKWDMSPGYDFPSHWGFERPIKLACVICHAGRVEERDGATHRLNFHEMAVGCENCHGPGSLHEELHRTRKLAPGEEDATIVHPSRLDRPLLESICAACHQSGAAIVEVRGRKPGDFRPGMPLSDFRSYYQLDNSGDKMTVVGHIEQLRQSACYQKSEGLTCVTCHDPHHPIEAKEQKTFYREKCLTCHTSQSCKSPPEDRRKSGDDCMACHMPRGDTEIPHVAFTHHRVGLHEKAGPSADALLFLPADTAPRLVPVVESPGLSPLDRQRNLGLAYVEAFRNPVHGRYGTAFRERARELLESVHAAGLKEGEVTSALAEIYRDMQEADRAARFARETLADPNAAANPRALALFVLAECERSNLDYASAATHMEEAARLRRSADYWRFLGANYLDGNQIQKAIPAFNTALSIRPFRNQTYLGLAEAYRRLGDLPAANDYLRKAKWLVNHNQD